MAQTQILKTNNALLNMIQYDIPVSSIYDSYHINGVPNDAIGRDGTTANSKALKTIKLEELLTKRGTGYTIAVPTDNVTVSDDSSWDYFSIYDQNSFDANRYVFSKPATRSISISGTFIETTTANAIQNDVVLGSDYILKNMISDLNTYCIDTKKYYFSILNQSLGSYFVPKTFSISIPGNDIANATWKMDFIGPPCDTLLTSTTRQTVLDQVAYRALNTRDFYCIPKVNSQPIYDKYIVNLDVSVELEWEQIPAFGSYKNNLGYMNIPSAYYWSMKDQRCLVNVTELYNYNSDGYIPLSYNLNNQLMKTSTDFDSIQVDYNNSTIFNLNKLIWQTANVEFKTDSLIAIKRSGRCHDIFGGANIVQ